MRIYGELDSGDYILKHKRIHAQTISCISFPRNVYVRGDTFAVLVT